jgi:hypothetical protein
MNAEHCGRFALVAIGSAQSGLDEFLFECIDSFVEEDSFLDHFSNKGLQLLSHG